MNDGYSFYAEGPGTMTGIPDYEVYEIMNPDGEGVCDVIIRKGETAPLDSLLAALNSE
jgi:hypothetical protein